MTIPLPIDAIIPDLTEALARVNTAVLVAPPGSRGTALLLARAATPEQASRICDQAGGRVFLFLDTDDFHRDHKKMTERGVKFVRPPSKEEYGWVAVFEDLYGNKWDLVERRR